MCHDTFSFMYNLYTLLSINLRASMLPLRVYLICPRCAGLAHQPPCKAGSTCKQTKTIQSLQ